MSFVFLIVLTVSGAYTCILACAQSCLFDPLDCSPPDFSVHELFQAKILKWVAISSFRGFPNPGNQTCVSCDFCIGRQILYQ